MSNARRIILEWAERGHIAVSDVPQALALAGVLPSRDAWRGFIDRLLLWLGTLLVGGGLIFFLAYNWTELGRFSRFALVEVLLLAALAVVWRVGLDRPGGKAALFAACLFVGALLALIGQTYQTGADTFELFGAWAAMILPWVLVAHTAALWILWLTLVNLAIVLYFQAFPGVFGMLFGTERQMWVLFAFNTAALCVWELLATRRDPAAGERWGPRLMASASGGLITALAMMQILDPRDSSLAPVLAWLVWLALAWVVYRLRLRDLFVLAGGVLSVIVVVATFLARRLDGGAAGFLLTGLIVLALSAVGGWWLKKVAAEDVQ